MKLRYFVLLSLVSLIGISQWESSSRIDNSRAKPLVSHRAGSDHAIKSTTTDTSNITTSIRVDRYPDFPPDRPDSESQLDSRAWRSATVLEKKELSTHVPVAPLVPSPPVQSAAEQIVAPVFKYLGALDDSRSNAVYFIAEGANVHVAHRNEAFIRDWRVVDVNDAAITIADATLLRRIVLHRREN